MSEKCKICAVESDMQYCLSCRLHESRPQFDIDQDKALTHIAALEAKLERATDALEGREPSPVKPTSRQPCLLAILGLESK